MDWAGAIACKRCDYAFQEVAQDFPEEQSHEQFEEHGVMEADAEYGEEPYQEEGFAPEAEQYAQPSQDVPNYSDPYSGSKPSIKMAVTSMVFGILGMPFISMIWGMMLAIVLMIMLGGAGAVIGGGAAVLILPIGLIFGIVALVRSNRRPTEYGGKGFAIAGIVCNSIGLVMLPLIAAIVIPNLLTARRAANEGSAIFSIQTIAKAETAFRSQNSGRCASLEELGQFDAIDSVLAKGQKAGYRYIIASLPAADGGCEIMAVPVSESVASRSFFYSTEDGIIRAAAKKGELANKMDPPLDVDYGNQKPQISSRK